MTDEPIRIARVYTLEGDDHLDEVLRIVHDEEGIANVHAFRAIAGTGGGRDVHTASLLALSLRLPVIVEFFAEEEKVLQAIDKLQRRLDLHDIITWPVERAKGDGCC